MHRAASRNDGSTTQSREGSSFDTYLRASRCVGSKHREISEKRRSSQLNLLAQSRVPPLIVARAFDKKIFENESVFPAVERSAAADATHFRVNGCQGFGR